MTCAKKKKIRAFARKQQQALTCLKKTTKQTDDFFLTQTLLHPIGDSFIHSRKACSSSSSSSSSSSERKAVVGVGVFFIREILETIKHRVRFELLRREY
jgi:hypothetical protein